LFESRRHGGLLRHGIVAFLGFGRRNVADGLQEPPVVEPVHPFEGSELHRLERAPRPAPMDDLGLIEAIDRLGEGIVVAVADTADRRLDAGLGEALGIFDRDVLHAPIRVVDEHAVAHGPALAMSAVPTGMDIPISSNQKAGSRAGW